MEVGELHGHVCVMSMGRKEEGGRGGGRLVAYRRNHGTTGSRDDGITGPRRSYQCKFRVVTDVYARDTPKRQPPGLKMHENKERCGGRWWARERVRESVEKAISLAIS